MQNHFIGMWAFAIWDGKNKKLFIWMQFLKTLLPKTTKFPSLLSYEIKFVKSLLLFLHFWIL